MTLTFLLAAALSLQGEIDAVAEKGGGRVTVPAGEYFSDGPIRLKSNVELHLEEGAKIVFSDDPAKYLPAVPTSWEGVECLNYSPLLYRNGFDAGRCMSFEAVVNAHKAEYYEALKESSAGWNESQPRYFPFMLNFLSTLYECYNELDRRFGSVAAAKVSKKRRIEATVLNSFTPLGKSDICAMLPDVSPTTVEAVLGAMVRGGLIRRLGGGRGTKYIKA